MNSSVLLLVFNRPETTQQVFEAIREAKPPRLYIAADGPRDDKPQEKKRCDEVRRIVSSVDWKCDIKKMFRNTNHGCKKGVSSGIEWFFENEEEGIILEDDCLPNQSFFLYCDDLLKRYRNDTRIGMIAGSKFGRYTESNNSDYFFSRLVQIWGWASWRRSWKLYDINIRRYPEFIKCNGYKKLGISGRIEKYTKTGYDLVFQGGIDTWDYQWSFAMLSNGMLTAVPRVSMIKNIGYGEDATHTKNQNKKYDAAGIMELGEIIKPIKHPEFIIPDDVYDMKKTESADFITRVIRKINCIKPVFK